MSSVETSQNLKTVKSYALFLTIVRALKAHLSRQSLRPGTFVLLPPDGMSPDEYDEPAEEIGKCRMTAVPAHKFKCLTIKDRVKRDNFARQITEAMAEAPFGILVTADVGNLPDALLLTVDHIITLPTVTPADLVTACKVVLELEVSRKQARELLAYRLDDVGAAMKPGRSVEMVLARLRSLSAKIVQRTRSFEVAPLQQMAGYGPAQAWGLQLAQDLSDWRDGQISWSEVDSGLLLSGPPGCGKTIFAASLAKTCNVSLIATSAAQWQAAGHLGDFLKAMRASFSAAVTKAPSLLFIDEIDSIGDRQAFSGDNKAYSVQVVNGLLEAMDGLAGREGVVVIGATNFPGNLDAALTRPGRLDKHIAIPLPDPAARMVILQQHLGTHVALDQIEHFGGRTEGMSGADLSQIARNAKRRARLAKRGIVASDVEATLPSVTPVTGEYRRFLAYHEAGHAVVGTHLKIGELVGLSISSHLHGGEAPQRMGVAQFVMADGPFRDCSYYVNYIAMLLSGMLAEKLALGTFGDGWALGKNSDLARATLVATQVEGSLGMGATLAQLTASTAQEWERIRRSDPLLNRRVDELLKREMMRATAILETEAKLLHAVANHLEQDGSVSPNTIEELRRSLSP